MDEAPPPTDHVLRPHHISLLIILSAAFKDLDIQKAPSEILLHIHRVLLNEIAEVCPQRTVLFNSTYILSGFAAQITQRASL